MITDDYDHQDNSTDMTIMAAILVTKVAMSNVQADPMVALLHDNGRDPDVATDDGHDNLCHYHAWVVPK